MCFTLWRARKAAFSFRLKWLQPALMTNTRQIEWSTSDASVVSISRSGYAEAIGPGKAVVTAKCTNPDNLADYKSDQLVLSVNARLDINNTLKLSPASMLSEDKAELISGKTVVWQIVEGEEFASIDEEGKIVLNPERPAEGGKVVVRGTCEGIDDIEFVIEVATLVESVTITRDGEAVSELEIENGERADLVAVVLPEGASDGTIGKGITWVSGDPEAVEVRGVSEDSRQCRISAKKVTVEPVTVWAISDDAGISSSISITVKQSIAVNSLKIESETGSSKIMNVGKTLQLHADVDMTPASATEGREIVWSSDNESVASVDDDGLVTGNELGKAVITATSVKDPSKSDTFEVETIVSAIYFESEDAFCLQTKESKKTWSDEFGNYDDNYLEYATSDPTLESSWQIWDGAEKLQSAEFDDGLNRLYLRGKGNTKISNLTDVEAYNTNYGGFYIGSGLFRFTSDNQNIEIASGGDIMSLLDWEDPDNATMAEYAFCGLFANAPLTSIPELPRKSFSMANGCYLAMLLNCDKLVTAPELPAKKLSKGCYRYMFEGCDALKNLPEFSRDTRLAPDCYAYMFYKCTALEEIPDLPNRNLAENCYSYMFSNCTSLASIPDFSADVQLAKGCYSSMFAYCKNLEKAPELHATELAASCYSGMFSNCEKLETAPLLPATTLAPNCYSDMFYYCKAFKNVQETLPGINVERNSYGYMFYGCSSLEIAPNISGEIFDYGSCSSMFAYCTSLKKAPDLRGTVTEDGQFIFNYMFSNCTSLETAPVLAIDKPAYCGYQGMFNYCTALKSLPALPITNLRSGCYQNMFYGIGTQNIKFSTEQTEECPNEYITFPSDEEAKRMTIIDDSYSGVGYGISQICMSMFHYTTLEPETTYYTNVPIARDGN
ncbi:MAG TPA: hypothetical protein DCO86_01825 [Spirochaetaceae bacterium]|nr:hypothetical protein [Spirochaetaceae bacterium]